MILTLSSPVFAFVELESRCNNRCPGCGNVFASDRVPPLVSGQWHIIFSKLKPHISRLKITGGEPTLHPEFEEIIGLIHRLDIPFSLFTNARWSCPERLLAFLTGIPEFTGFLISLHGAAAASHEAFTGVPKSFAETVANIRRAVAAGLSVTTSTVVTKHNYSEVGQIVALSKELGAHHAVFNRYLGQRLPDIEPTNGELKEAIQAIERLHAAGHPAKFGNCIPQCFYPSSSSGCLAGVAYCTVDPWGNVRPCNHASLICGNLLEQSIEEIWNSEAMKHWRGLIPTECETCLEFPRCHGGCRAVAMELGIEKDPLIVKPVLEKLDEPLEELTLYEGAYPIGKFDIRSEEFGYVLIYSNRVVPVSHQAKVILDSLDGQTTLRQIEETYGRPGLSFVGSLYQQGLVGLR
jgi:radical SAM protein with 4Fe4S-binding SPASM domain